jgi:hypothetical protein
MTDRSQLQNLLPLFGDPFPVESSARLMADDDIGILRSGSRIKRLSASFI